MLEQLRAAVSSDQVVDSDKLAANLTKALGNDPALAQIGTDVSTQVMNAISAQIAAQLGRTLTQGCLLYTSRDALLQARDEGIFSSAALEGALARLDNAEILLVSSSGVGH